MYAYRVYGNYERNRKLLFIIITLSFFVFVSLGWNVKQLFDINNYQKLIAETQDIIANVLQAPVNGVIPLMATAPLSSIVSSPPVETQPVVFKPVDRVEPKKTELQCLSENIYYEAGNQSLVGKLAVGHVTINRMNNPKYPKTICGVVNQRIDGVCMFSWKCEEPKPINNNRAWKESQQVAYELLSKNRNDLLDITEGATHFHNARVKPGWRHHRVTRIDDHIFYRQ